MPKYTFQPEHPGHTFAVGKERARAVPGQTYELTEEQAAVVIETIPGAKGDSLKPVKAAAAKPQPKGRGKKAQPEPEPEVDADDESDDDGPEG